MKCKAASFLLFFLAFLHRSSAQLVIMNDPVVQNLVQKLVGNGVSVTNITFTGNNLMAGHFYNQGNTNINIDSGIVLTTGRAKTSGTNYGVDNRSFTAASATLADNSWNLPGDPNLSAALGGLDLHDACILEFDFVPLGDSIKFNYVFSSEEYDPQFVCSFNDAFAFFISGPGITGLKNLALVPNTNTPVSILNVNNVANNAGVPLCPNNITYFVDNTTNIYFTHDGHVVRLSAKEKVTPCQTYHLKLVIADAVDDFYDSAVFLEAKSLVSNAITLGNQAQVDPQTGSDYLVEGCNAGSFSVTRPRRDPTPLVVNLSYGGTVINGTDVGLLPSSVVIPANDSVVTVTVTPLIDALNEPIELLKIFASSGCATGLPTDSTEIQVRDFDILPLIPDTAYICKSNSIQLSAPQNFSTYQWSSSPNSVISNPGIRDPLVTPAANSTLYTVIASNGTCRSQDSLLVEWKKITLLSKIDVLCRDGNTGEIRVSAGPQWSPPLAFSWDGVNWQTDSSFTNLLAGTYWIKVRDNGCTDSIAVTISQAFPDLQLINIVTTPGGCSGNADATISFSASGGNGTYTYSLDNGPYQASNNFNTGAGIHTISVKDGNGCTASQQVNIAVNSNLQADAGPSITLCEGNSHLLTASSNGTSFSWTPSSGLNDATLLNPIASPVVTTWYYLTAKVGTCSVTDSVLITVRPAPVANAGPDISICKGKTFQLDGSGGVSYEWDPNTYFISPPNVAQPLVTANTNISYSLFVTDAFNCRTLVPDVVNIKVTAPVRLFAGNDTTAIAGQPIQLNAIDKNNAGITSYTWTPAIFLSDPLIRNPVAILQSDQRFMVTGKTLAGCEGQDDILIKVYKGPDVYVPSGFTPNHDGKNDRLKPVAAGIKDFKYFRVFNRLGQLVYSGNGNDTGWDGTINNVLQPPGVYVWILEAIDYKGNHLLKKGVVTLIR